MASKKIYKKLEFYYMWFKTEDGELKKVDLEKYFERIIKKADRYIQHEDGLMTCRFHLESLAHTFVVTYKTDENFIYFESSKPVPIYDMKQMNIEQQSTKDINLDDDEYFFKSLYIVIDKKNFLLTVMRGASAPSLEDFCMAFLKGSGKAKNQKDIEVFFDISFVPNTVALEEENIKKLTGLEYSFYTMDESFKKSTLSLQKRFKRDLPFRKVTIKLTDIEQDKESINDVLEYIKELKLISSTSESNQLINLQSLYINAAYKDQDKYVTTHDLLRSYFALRMSYVIEDGYKQIASEIIFNNIRNEYVNVRGFIPSHLDENGSYKWKKRIVALN